MTDRNRVGSSGHGWRGLLRHPFWQAVLILTGSWLLIRIGIVYLPPLFGVRSAPVPGSVLMQYMLTVLVGVLLYVSADEERWMLFKQPIHRLLVDPQWRVARATVLVAVPLLVGFGTYLKVSASVGSPSGLRSVHPAPPTRISFKGRTLRLEGLDSPLRGQGSMEDHLATGATVYVRNCVPCHGDRLDGRGHYAHAFSPVPADFTSNGTIAQLTESYVFWRVAKGGPGLPKEGTPWNSAMPAWEDFLSEDEIWAVILYLYDRTGWTPLTWEHDDEEGAR